MTLPPIKLVISGIGHVPSFKNSKLVVRNRPLTKPEYQKWMNAAVESLTSQLRSAFRTSEIGTMTGPSLLSWIASFLPLDDSRKWIVRHSASTQLVSKGNEGAEITITPV